MSVDLPLENRPLRILSLGAGAIGTYIGGSLVLAGHSVVYLEKLKVVDELIKRGLRLDLSADRNRKRSTPFFVRPMAFTATGSIEEALQHGPFDIALFAIKSYDTSDVLSELKPYADRLPPFLCLSNGVENEKAIGAMLGVDKVIYGTVTTAIGKRGVGDIMLEKQRGIGVARGHLLSEILVLALDDAHLNCRKYADGPGMKWSKMLTNLIANPTSAILDWTPSQVLAHRGIFRLEIRMLTECLAVMKALGLKVVDLPGTPVRALAFMTRLPTWLSKPVLSRSAGAGRGAKMPSFHIDLHSRRKKSEVAYLHGAVASEGDKLGIPTPVNQGLTKILQDLTSGVIPIDEYKHQPDKLIDQF
jgi:2-dehydropantoate 2-reductase